MAVSNIKGAFLSSTSRDLENFRDSVYKAIEGLDGFHCDRMEDYGSRSYDAKTFDDQRVKACDIFIGIVGHIYGECPENEDISYSELEYDAAIEHGKHILIFLASKEFKISAKDIESDDKRLRLERFRDKIDRTFVRSTFSEPAELSAEVIRAIRNWERENEPAVFTESSIPSSDDLKDRINRLEIEDEGTSTPEIPVEERSFDIPVRTPSSRTTDFAKSDLSVLEFNISNLEAVFSRNCQSEHGPANGMVFRYFYEYLNHLGTKTIVTERGFRDDDYLRDYSSRYIQSHFDVSKYCTRIHFFQESFTNNSLIGAVIGATPSNTLKQSYLGFAVVHPLDPPTIGKAVLALPQMDDDFQNIVAVRTHNIGFMGIRIDLKSAVFREEDANIYPYGLSPR